MAQLEQLQTDHSQQEELHDEINLQNLKYQLEEVIGGTIVRGKQCFDYCILLTVGNSK